MNMVRQKLDLVLLGLGLTHNTVLRKVTNVRVRVRAKLWYRLRIEITGLGFGFGLLIWLRC